MRKVSDWLKQRSETAVGIVDLVPAITRAVVEPYRRSRKGADARGRLRRNPAGLTGIVCFLIVTLLAVIDGVYTPEITFTLFYLLIVASAAWVGGRKTGVFVACVSSLALAVPEIFAREALPQSVFWNLGLQIGVYFFTALLVSAVRGRTENLERRVLERTVAHEKEISERRQTEEQLRKTMQQFRQLAENITDAFWMRDAGEARMAYVSPAYEKIWGRACKTLYQSPQLWLEAIHPEDRDRVAHHVARAMATRRMDADFSQEYRITRPDGTLRWIRDRAFPIRDSSGRVVRLVGIAEDITDRRRLEREILEISDREQARMGQDLHDGLCQKLVSVAFDNDSLERKLAARGVPEAVAVQQMAEVLDDLITEARALARGLFPVQLETDGLSVALQHLAAGVGARAKLNCHVDCSPAVSVSDNAMATHLYRIAQEAVNNAVKHSKAGNITIQLRTSGKFIELTVTDDGIGVPTAQVSSGMGMHIMDYRARTIGGSLNVQRGPHGGTVVSCLTRQQI